MLVNNYFKNVTILYISHFISLFFNLFILKGRLGVSPECFAHLTHLLMTVVHLNPSVYTLNHRKDSPIISTPTRQTRQRLQQEKSISYSGGLVLALEGGYQLTALSQCVAYCVAALLGDYCPRLASNLSISEK